MSIDFKLRKPCDNCPFRNDRHPFITGGRAWEIADALKSGGTFPCHKTTVPNPDEDAEQDLIEGDKTQMCAGAMICMEKAESGPNQIMRIAERVGMYDVNNLELDSPIYPSLAEFVDAHYNSEES